MIPDNITITYRSKQFILDRENTDGKYFQIGFKSDKWSVHIYILPNGDIRTIIDKAVKKSDGVYSTQFQRTIIDKAVKKSDGVYSTQFHWDCYCVLNEGGLSAYEVNDPATCKRISNSTRWFDIAPVLREIHAQLKEELDALHPFDLVDCIKSLQGFIFRKMRGRDGVEYTVNETLRFGIGENAYAPSEIALQAKAKEPIVLLNLFDGNHIVSTDTIIFFLYWLSDRDGKLTLSDGRRAKDIPIDK